MSESNAYPDLELKVSIAPDGACAVFLCPYCDTEVPLHWAHECPQCGGEFDITVTWSA